MPASRRHGVTEKNKCSSLERTTKAFDKFRKIIGSPRLPRESQIGNRDELKIMTKKDGLEIIHDGPISENNAGINTQTRLIEQSELDHTHLWVVKIDDVVHALESCQFGKGLQTGCIKHTNLTGGEAAYAGGELIRLGDTLVVNGKSGRYGPKSTQEMTAIVQAFADAGYHVWSMGYDTETNKPYPFIGRLPQCVA